MKVNAYSRRAWVSVTTALIIAMSAFGSHSSTVGAADIKATLRTDQKRSPVGSTESDRGSIAVGAGKSLSGTVTTSSATVTGGQDQEWAPRQSAPGLIALMQTGDTYRIPANARLSDAQVVIFEDVPPPVLPLFFVAAACLMVPLGLMRIMLSHGIVDNDVACILPSVTTALKSWSGHDLPPETAYEALITDLRALREAETPASERCDAAQLRHSRVRSLLFAIVASAAATTGGEVRGQPNGNRVSAESDHRVLLAPNTGKLACSVPTG
jgi:hypothetical protein